MKRFDVFLLALATGLFVIGCNSGEDANRSRYETLKDGDVILRYKGNALTKGEVEKDVACQVAKFRYVKPKAKESSLQKYGQHVREESFKTHLLRWELNECIAKSGTRVGDDLRKEFEGRFVASCGKRGVPFEAQVDAVYGAELKPHFLKGFEQELQLESYFRNASSISNEVYVSEAEARKKLDDILRYNAKADATNRLIAATASMVVRRIKAGDDFLALAKQFNQDDEPVVGQYVEAEFSDEPVIWQTASQMKPGQVSELLRLKEGSVIIKLLEVVPPETSESGERELKLARIFFNRAMLFDVPRLEDMPAQMEPEKRIRFMKKLYSAINQDAAVYPFGKDIFVPPAVKKAREANLKKQKGNAK